MRVVPFLIMISVIFLVGLGIYYFGGGWSIFAIFPFALDIALIAIKVDNAKKKFVENL